MSVDVTIGAKTSGFSRGLAKLENEWGGFKQKLARKFSIADIGKGLLQGAGIGSFEAITRTLQQGFQMAADAAKLMEERTAATLQTTLKLISLKREPSENIDLTKKELRGTQVAIERQKQAVKDADMGPLLLISDQAMSNYKEAEAELTALLKKEQDLTVSIEEQTIAERKRKEVLAEEVESINDQYDILNKQITPVEAAERALDRISKRNANLADLPGKKEREIDAGKAALDTFKAQKEFELAQVKGVKADSLARIGGGGNVYAPSGAQQANPAQAILGESQSQTKLLKSIDYGVTRMVNGGRDYSTLQ